MNESLSPVKNIEEETMIDKGFLFELLEQSSTKEKNIKIHTAQYSDLNQPALLQNDLHILVINTLV